jgi:hypothetical protein
MDNFYENNGSTHGQNRVLRLVDEFLMVMMRLRLGLLLEDLSTAVRFPTLRQFKQCISIPDVMLKIMHLAMQKSSHNGREKNSCDFWPVSNSVDQNQTPRQRRGV